MGNRPTATIFVGVSTEDASEIVMKGLLAVGDPYEEGPEIENPVYGGTFRPQVFHCYDEITGYGIEIHRTDWDCNDDSVSLAQMADQAGIAKGALRKYFNENDLDLTIQTFIACDYT